MHWGIESQVPWLALHDGLPRKPIEGDADYMAMRSIGDGSALPE
jgi:hypothetical protein